MSAETNRYVGRGVAEYRRLEQQLWRVGMSVDCRRDQARAGERRALGFYRAVATVFILLYSLLTTAQAAETVTYYYTSPQGTVLATADSAGNLLDSIDYRSYGTQALGAPEQGPGYTGHVSDVDSGFVYMQARYYDPAIGRFLSTDPVVPKPGDTYNFNRQAYANNNPILNVDRDGRQSVPGYYLNGTDFRSPETREFAFNAFVPGYAVYGCAATGCGGSGWTIAIASTFLSVTPLGEAAALSRVARVARTAEQVGNEAHSAVNAVKLSKSLASESQASEQGTVIAGEGSNSIFRNSAKAAENYGGSASDWVKKSSSSYTAKDGTQFETHWIENTVTGDRKEYKTILEKSIEPN